MSLSKTLPASSAKPAALCTLHFLVSGSDVPLCSLFSRELGSGRWQFLQKCGRCDKFETCTPLHIGARLESDMWIAVITGAHSRPFGLLEISLILTFGGSLVSFSCGWKSVSSSGRFCLLEGKWIPIPVRSSPWSEGSQWMRWKKSLNCNPNWQ